MRVRDRLTAATAELMQRHGVAGTGIAEILATSGVARRSIYLNFPGGKAELVAAATRSSGAAMATALTGYLAEPDPIASFTRMWSRMLVESDFEGGCPILAAAGSRDEAPEAAEAAAGVFAQWTQLIAARLIDDGIEPVAAVSLSSTIISAMEGAVVFSRAARSTEPLEQAHRHLEELLALHRPPAT